VEGPLSFSPAPPPQGVEGWWGARYTTAVLQPPEGYLLLQVSLDHLRAAKGEVLSIRSRTDLGPLIRFLQSGWLPVAERRAVPRVSGLY
jgi:hypothetical protein